MKQRTPFRLLLQIFEERFFESDTVSPGGGFETNIYQVMGFLAAAGFFTAYFLMPAFLELSARKPGPATDWALRSFRLCFPSVSFAVIGFATFFEWDMLFPDRRDFLILTPFPIRLRDLFGAKIGALSFFLILLIGSLNLFPTVMMALFCIFDRQFHGIALRLLAAQIGACVGASAFAFFAVAAFQGLLINLTSPKVFRRISPWIQMSGMSLMVCCLLTLPIYAMLLRPAAETHQEWLSFLPPVWFTGLYEVLLPLGNPTFTSFGIFAFQALAVAMIAFTLTWALGFRRHYRRSLETEDTTSRRLGRNFLRRLPATPQEGAILAFSGKTLARSTKHQMFLATYLSVGISIGLLSALRVTAGSVNISGEGLLALPFLVEFFVISGLRAVFQFPAELASNWIFQITEARWIRASRLATRKRVLLGGLAPVLLFVSPIEIYAAGWQRTPRHLAFQLAAGALLIELVFWAFDKVPFTCSYFQGKFNLSLLAGFYLYGFTTYSFNMADLESFLDHHAGWSLPFFAATAVALSFSWRRRTPPSEVRFDGYEPVIQTLDLT